MQFDIPLPPSLRLFELDILPYTLDQAVDALTAAVQPHAGPARVVATPNTDHIVLLSRDASLAQRYAQADYLFADGMPLVWASRWLGAPLPERVAGSDLTLRLCERAPAMNWRVAIVGGFPGEETDLAARLTERYPGLDVQIFSPPMGFSPQGPAAEALARQIAAKQPDIVFVCLGFPKQELWALQFANLFTGGLLLCVGSAIRFASGQSQRAPLFLQKIGLEWLWRLFGAPGQLWRRYLRDAACFPLLCCKEWRTRR